jgi:hypothetical protein
MGLLWSKYFTCIYENRIMKPIKKGIRKGVNMWICACMAESQWKPFVQLRNPNSKDNQTETLW